MTDYVREHGRYSRAVAAPEPVAFDGPTDPRLAKTGERPAGSVVPWHREKAGLPSIMGDEEIVRRTIGGLDGWAYAFLWTLVVSF